MMLYRCLKLLRHTRVSALKKAGSDHNAISAALDETEQALTARIDFGEYMG